MSRFVISHHSIASLGLTLSVSAALAVAAAGVPGAQAAPGHPAKSTTKWTKISKNTGLGIASPGLFRTADGRLHVIWPSHDGPGSFSLHYSTVGGQSKLLATGTVVSHWGAIAMFPRLLPGKNGGLQLLLDGTEDSNPSNPYSSGSMYLATSNSAGKSWKLVPGSLAHSGVVPLTDFAGATEPNGTPVAAWDEVTSLAYHVGVDPSSPAASADQHLSIGAAGDLVDPTLVRISTGKIVAGWFNGSGNFNQGYWAAQIWPSQGPKMKAPGSGSAQANGQPEQPVALVARPGGGSYLAYCVATKIRHCGHIALWRVGAAKALTVPGSSSGSANLVTLTAGHAGHLWISWFDTGTNKISVVRTNTAVTRFGQVRTISVPGPVFEFNGLSSLGGSGPLDLIALEAVNGNPSPAYFDTELFPALRIHASRASVSNLHSTTITFTLDDSGDSVPGVTVKFLGKSAKTNSKGVVKFTVQKGTTKGKHTVVATKAGYASATFTVKVT